jgi:formylmethanofuran dehydrogenase subunit D
MVAEVEVTIVTVQDIFQDEAKKKSRFSEEYRNLSALIVLDRQDMARLAAKDGQRLLVKNEAGSVVVAAKTSGDESHPGLAFMNHSPWSNQLVADPVSPGSIPGSMCIKATVSPAEAAANLTPITELFSRMRTLR